jgi:hypothetical protein
MLDLEAALPEFEFVYGRGGYSAFGFGASRLWYPFIATDDPGVADQSLNDLDDLWDEEGPFEAILGFSQGASMTSIYLAHRQMTYGEHGFERAVMAGGFINEDTSGLTEKIEMEAPFADIPSLHYIGWYDNTILPVQSLDVIPYYTDPIVTVDAENGHIVPFEGTPRFDEVVSFLRGELICPLDNIVPQANQDCAMAASNPNVCDKVYLNSPVSVLCPETCGVCYD